MDVLREGPAVLDDAEMTISVDAPEVSRLRPVAAEGEPTEGPDGLVEALRGPEVGDPDPEVVDAILAPARTPVVHGLDAVAVRIQDEAAVVILGVLRPRAGMAVVRMACAGHRRPPLVHGFARRGHEGGVKVACDRPVAARR